MIVSLLDYGSGLCAGLAMASTVRASDRINLYPAAPIRLATMLHTWTIVQRWDGANLLDGIFTSIAICQIAVVIQTPRMADVGT